MPDFSEQEARWLHEAELAHSAGDAAAEAKALRLVASARRMLAASASDVRAPLDDARRLYLKLGDAKSAASVAIDVAVLVATIPGVDVREIEEGVRAAAGELERLGDADQRSRALVALADLLRRSKRAAEAEKVTLEAIALLPPGHARLSKLWRQLGKEQEAQGNVASARLSFARSLDAAGEDPSRRLLALNELVRLAEDEETLGRTLLDMLETIERAMKGKLDPLQLAQFFDLVEPLAQSHGWSLRTMMRDSDVGALAAAPAAPPWLRVLAKTLARLSTPS